MTESQHKSEIELKLIRELAQLLNETGLTEIEVKQDELRIRVTRQTHVTTTVPMVAPPSPAPQASVVAIMPPATLSAGPISSPTADASHPGVVKSPMVGTAYLGAAPGAKPFVEIGTKVNQGDRVMIVEAMKTFNDITAPHSGTVTKLLIEDKQPVEYGQPLMIIE